MGKKCAKYKITINYVGQYIIEKKDNKLRSLSHSIFQLITTYLSCFIVSRNRLPKTNVNFIKHSAFVHLIGWTISDIGISVHLINMKHLIYSSDNQ